MGFEYFGLEVGIDIRKISSGLRQLIPAINEEALRQNLQEKLLDEINGMISGVGLS